MAAFKMLTHVVVHPHDLQRYDTVGDWNLSASVTLAVYVSDLGDERYERLVAIHEEIEATLCKFAGIKEVDVSAFDKDYEEQRRLIQASVINKEEFAGQGFCGCIITADSEPGDDIHAPYYRQHQIATGVERMLAAEIGVNWNEYDNKINSLEYHGKEE